MNERDPMKSQDVDRLTKTLQRRFEQHPRRHERIVWSRCGRASTQFPRCCARSPRWRPRAASPDVIGRDESTGRLVFCDCSAQSPEPSQRLLRPRRVAGAQGASAAGQRARHGRRDRHRAAHRGAVPDAAAARRVRHQDVELDPHPPEVRALGGALFCDRRYGKVFVYHNGAQSYYASRGFRGCVQV